MSNLVYYFKTRHYNSRVNGILSEIVRLNFFFFSCANRALIRDNLLIIPNVQVEDEGEYTCVATNQLASIEAKAYLIVYGKINKLLNINYCFF